MSLPSSRRPVRPAHHQRGIALVTALLIVTLATVTAVAIASHQAFDIRRSANLFEADQAYVYALGAEQLAKEGLLQDAQQSTIDSIDELWAQPAGGPLEDGSLIAAQIEDLQGRFNLNNLAAAEPADRVEYLKQFERLLRILDLNPDLKNAVMDWVDSDQNVTLPGGAEDLDYLNLSEQPYRAANRMMSSPSELRLIKGFEDPEVYRKLAPYVTALPTVTPINVNTAGPVILRLFDDSINEGVAEKLTRLVPPAEDGTPVQPLEPFEEAGDFYTELRAQLSLNPDDKLAIIGFEVFSSHFLMTVDATTGDTTVRLHSVLTRANNQVRVMLRGLGNYSG